MYVLRFFDLFLKALKRTSKILRTMHCNVNEPPQDPQSIQLPIDNEVVFRNLSKAKRFAIDIGGSLTKIAYYSTVPVRRALYSYSSEDGSKSDEEMSYEVSHNERLHFVKFETKYIGSCLDFIQKNLVNSLDDNARNTITATGGGSYKYAELINSKLGLLVDKADEIECLIKGCNFLLKNIPNEVFLYQRQENPQYQFQNTEHVFPYLLVNIGSGVSILKVESESQYERIGGSSLGGGTFCGLGSLLTKAQNFDELLQLANRGDHRNVDMLVKDIYGGDYKMLGLHGELIASSFGKAVRSSNDSNSNAGTFSEEDIARSLLFTISNDIGQIACLYAMMNGLKRIYFGGYFLRGHPLSMYAIGYSINFWSQGKAQALFLRHEGYLGAIGAFLKGAEEYEAEKYSWNENYAGSSGLQSPIPAQMLSKNNHATADQLEMDRFDLQLVYCPLLDNSEKYVADSVDLMHDTEAREYWLQCFEEATDKFVEVAVASQGHSDDSQLRASKFKKKYLVRLRHLHKHPFAYGPLTVRSLLDMREHCLNELDFPDPYFQQKQSENESSMKLLPSVLQQLETMAWEDRQKALICGVLAGNVFDWGAKEVASLMENGDFGFNEAKNHLQPRPWLVDNFDGWLERLRGTPHNCAAIFVDNSGIDVVLGIMPFVRELLLRGTNVVLCANSKPALNDVTYQELMVLIREVGLVCPLIASSFDSGNLLAMDSGQSSPCLDLSRLNATLSETLLSRGVDLVVLEGMGRAVHTNLNAKFKVESLKLAVLKNKWLANRLGGNMFSIMCQYEPVTTTLNNTVAQT